MSTSSRNGTAHRRLSSLADGLRPELELAERQLEEAQAAVEHAKARVELAKADVTSIRRAIDALDPPPKDATARRPPGRPPSERPAPLVRPSEENLELVLAALVAAPEPQTKTMMAERLADAVSHDTVRRALLALRDDGRVRVAGKTDSGGALYAPMPEELGKPDGPGDGGSALWAPGKRAAA